MRRATIDPDEQKGTQRRLAYSYRHLVSFEETNLMGNVYFTRHLSWQGRCREMFLRDHAPDVLGELANGLRLVTLRVTCDYFEEARAFDELEIAMRLDSLRGHRIALTFEYLRPSTGSAPIAYGEQEIGCMRLYENGMDPVPPPSSLARALARYC